MAKPTFDQLIVPLKQADIFASLVRTLSLLGVDVTAWRAGAPLRTLLALTAAIQAAFTTTVAELVKTAFLDTATGGWLRLLAWYRYGIEARTSTQATGNVTLVNASANLYDFEVDDLVIYPAAGGFSYRNTEAFELASGASASVAVQCEVVGPAGNLAAGLMTGSLPSLPGVTITQPAAIVGLADESDPQLRSRCAAKAQAISGAGPRSVYEYWAALATLPSGAVPTRVKVAPQNVFGAVKVYAATDTAVLDTADKAALATWLYAKAVPATVGLEVLDAVPVTVACTVDVYSPDYLDPVATASAVQAALVAFLGAVPIGGYTVGALTDRVFRSGAEAAVAAALLSTAGVPRPKAVTVAFAPAAGSLDSAGNLLLGPTAFPTAGTITTRVSG